MLIVQATIFLLHLLLVPKGPGIKPSTSGSVDERYTPGAAAGMPIQLNKFSAKWQCKSAALMEETPRSHKNARGLYYKPFYGCN